VNLSRLFNVYDGAARPDLKFRTYVPRELRLTAKSHDLFEEVRRHDILLHHPYDSYDAVLSFSNRPPKTSAFSRSNRLFTARASIR